ncbi:MAG: hypothetical protein LBD75_01975 [Candidatus Peribacteria bacterium]|nr:hypothetical protein [Candidatus Peribacteria bacterium]
MMSNPDQLNLLKDEMITEDGEGIIEASTLEDNLKKIGNTIDFPRDNDKYSEKVTLFDADKETVFAKFLADNAKLDDNKDNKLTATATEEEILNAFHIWANLDATQSSAKDWRLNFNSDIVLAYCGEY